MLKFFLLFFLLGCGPKLFKKDYLTLSESPCVDGTILNIDQAGCKSFYWGTDPSQKILKIRCTYAEEDNWWTGMSFYVLPNDVIISDDRPLFCTDIYVQVYAVPPGINIETNEK